MGDDLYSGIGNKTCEIRRIVEEAGFSAVNKKIIYDNDDVPEFLKGLREWQKASRETNIHVK